MARGIVWHLIAIAPVEGEVSDEEAARQESEGGSIRSHGPSKAYDKGWDRIFGKGINGSVSPEAAKPN